VEPRLWLSAHVLRYLDNVCSEFAPSGSSPMFIYALTSINDILSTIISVPSAFAMFCPTAGSLIVRMAKQVNVPNTSLTPTDWFKMVYRVLLQMTDETHVGTLDLRSWGGLFSLNPHHIHDYASILESGHRLQ